MRIDGIRVDASLRLFILGEQTMVLLEMSITPLGKGESVSAFVAECVDIIDRSGLDYELHAMGTIVEGELDQVLDLMRRCIEQTATHSDRVTCAAKLDFRRGHEGRLKSKVESVEQKVGRRLRKGEN
jgi:uncharacterized protein (TIGR00106 family)